MELDTVCRQFEPYLTAGCQGLGAEITELEIVQHTMRCVWLTWLQLHLWLISYAAHFRAFLCCTFSRFARCLPAAPFTCKLWWRLALAHDSERWIVTAAALPCRSAATNRSPTYHGGRRTGNAGWSSSSGTGCCSRTVKVVTVIIASEATANNRVRRADSESTFY